MSTPTITPDPLDIEPADFVFTDEQLEALAALLIDDASNEANEV